MELEDGGLVGGMGTDIGDRTGGVTFFGTDGLFVFFYIYLRRFLGR